MTASLALLLVSALWGATFVAIKEGLADASPLLFVGLRFLVAALVTAPGVRSRDAWRQALPAGIPLGIVLFLAYAAQTEGLVTTTPSRSAFLTGLSVPLVPLWSAGLLRRFPAASSLVGLVLALPGLWFLTSPGSGHATIGDLWTMGCAVFFALHVVLVARWAGRAGTLPLVAVQLGTTAVLALIASPALEATRAAPSARLVLAIALTAILATAGTTWLQMRFQPRLDPTRAALLYTMEPVFAALFAAWWGEPIPALAGIGGALIVAGAVVSELGARPRPGRGSRPGPARSAPPPSRSPPS